MGVQSRGELPPDYAEKEFYPMFQDVKGYGIQDVIETRYRDKNTVDPETAFAHLKNLIPSRENAFLFRKD